MTSCFECKLDKPTTSVKFAFGTVQLCSNCKKDVEEWRKARNEYIENEGVEK